MIQISRKTNLNAALLCLTALSFHLKADDGTYFEKKIRPLLEEHCVECHNSDEPESGLDLSSIQGIARGGKLGPVVNSKQPQVSRLLTAVRYTSKIKMPPDGRLDSSVVEVFEKWLAKGAVLPRFQKVREPGRSISTSDLEWWSFKPIERPALPEVRRAELARSPVDYFVLAKLDAAGLELSKQADKRTLIRRLSFNLLGLQPSEKDVKAFVSDTRPDAYERLVDRMLASPRYGERWGRHWLDAVRYADTNGGGFDYVYPQAWRYRDYVVRSFNGDTPYNRFLHEQLAGDLIWKPDEATDESRVFDPLLATGFLTLAPKGLGMQDKLQMRLDVVDDQIDVIGRSLMGITLACARCHDHKFDPIPTHDYYALAGILFSTISLKDTDKNPSYWPERALELPSITRARKAHAEQIATIKTTLQKLRQRGNEELISRAEARALDYVAAATRIHHSREALGLAAHFGFEQLENRTFQESQGLTPRLLNIKKKPQTLPISVDGRFGRGVRFNGDGDVIDIEANSLTDLNLGKVDDFSVSLWLRLPKGYVPKTADSVIAANYSKALWFLALRPGGYNGIYLRHYDGKRAVDIKPKTNILPILTDGKWHQIVVTSDRDRSGRVFLDGNQVGEVNIANVSQAADFSGLTKFQLGPSTNGFKGEIDDVAIWTRSLPNEFVQDLFDRGNKDNPEGVSIWRKQQLAIRATAQKSGLFYSYEQAESDGLTSPFLKRIINQIEAHKASATKKLVTRKFESVAALRQFLEQDGKAAVNAVAGSKAKAFVATVRLDRFFSQDLRSQLKRAVAQEQRLAMRTFPSPIKAMVAADDSSPNDMAIHIAGSHENKGQIAKRGFPLVVSKSMNKASPTKISGSGRLQFAHWLTDRSNPLTARVIANRIWQHHFGAGIVRTPDNFGQLGDKPSHPRLLDWLSSELMDSSWSLKRLHKVILMSATYRQSSKRKSNAYIVDSANRLLWRMNRRRLEAEPIRDAMLHLSGSLDLKMGGSNNSWKDKDFSVDDANNETANYTTKQRSIYLPIVRGASVHEMLRLFDFGDPNSIVAQRTATTVATQALFLLNDPFVVKQSELFAKRVLAQANTTEQRIQSAYSFAFGRAATDAEVQRAKTFLAKNELEEWKDFCHSLLCMNEFIYVN